MTPGWADARRVLAVRLDALGDVLMTGPALRALRGARADRRVTLLTSPAGAAAAELLPGVDEVWCFAAPWILADPPAVDAADVAWLRERVAAGAPTGFVPRPMDESTWNACAAAALGRAFVISTDERFFDAHQAIMAELESRLEAGALGRAAGFSGETSATFYYALAVDALVKV